MWQRKFLPWMFVLILVMIVIFIVNRTSNKVMTPLWNAGEVEELANRDMEVIVTHDDKLYHIALCDAIEGDTSNVQLIDAILDGNKPCRKCIADKTNEDLLREIKSEYSH